MAEVLRARQVHSDLTDIWLYIARDNITAADKLLDTIAAECQRLAEMPDLGRKREDLGPGLRSWPVGRYLIFYRKTAGGIEVIRVLHGARDLSALFGGAE